MLLHVRLAILVLAGIVSALGLLMKKPSDIGGETGSEHKRKGTGPLADRAGLTRWDVLIAIAVLIAVTALVVRVLLPVSCASGI